MTTYGAIDCVDFDLHLQAVGGFEIADPVW